jgi:hypothetical protein
MPTSAFYQQQAKIYFEMATMSRDKDMRARWIERANEHLTLADAIDDDVSQQPVAQQQQQQQAQPKKEKKE